MRWYQIGRWLLTFGLILFIPVFKPTVFERVMILGIALLWATWPWVFRKLRTRFWTCDRSLSLTDAEPCEDRVGLILAGWVTNGVLVKFDVIQYEQELVLSPVMFKSPMKGRRHYFAIPVDVPSYRGLDVILRTSTLNGVVIWHSDTELSIDRDSLAAYEAERYRDLRVRSSGAEVGGAVIGVGSAGTGSAGAGVGLAGWFAKVFEGVKSGLHRMRFLQAGINWAKRAYNAFSDWSDRFAEKTRMWHKWSGFTRKLSVRYRAIVRVITVPKFENHRTFRLKEVWNPSWKNQCESFLASKFLGLWILGGLIGFLLVSWELYCIVTLGRLEPIWALFV